MSKHQEPIEAPNAGAAALAAKIRFEDCDYTTEQTQRILAVGTTTFFTRVLPELESYLQGNRRIITGRSILAYRERKLGEPRQMSATGIQGSERLRKSRSRNEERRRTAELWP
jgi:hypothetical protein